jgi:hypothetical protein
MGDLFLKTGKYTSSAFGAVFIFYFLSLSTVNAAQVTLAWDPNNEADLAGYRVHYGTVSRGYQTRVDAGLNTTYRVTNLAAGVTYFFAVTAYDSSGNESAYSQEVAYGVPAVKYHFDYDGDKTTDVSAYHLPTNQFLIESIGSLGAYGWSGSDSMPLVWDYNGDGKTDISIYHIPTNQWFVKGGTNENLGQFGFGMEDSVPVPGDYDGSGVLKRAFYHLPTNRWFIEGQNPISFGWGGADCIPLPGDYDGDGKTDLMVYHVPSNQWFMYGLGNLGQFGWGGADSIPVPADYDGDGAVEIAVYHLPTQQWLLKGYPNENTGQFGWGASALFPIPGDYNGDGMAERAFYRPAENSWFIEGEPEFTWGWDGANFIPAVSQISVINWYRFRLGMFQ